MAVFATQSEKFNSNNSDKMTKKKWAIIFTIVSVLFFGSIFYRNIATFKSLKDHTGYTFGTIIKVWNDDGWYSRYQYTVNGITFQGRRGRKYNLQDTILIVYDATKPRFSMIAKYSLPIILDRHNRLIGLDTTIVNYEWWDYLPGDEIHSIKDLWSLD
jgi:hypothetical protein